MSLAIVRYAALAAVTLGVAGCGSSLTTTTTTNDPIPQGKPHAIQPTAGAQAADRRLCAGSAEVGTLSEETDAW